MLEDDRKFGLDLGSFWTFVFYDLPTQPWA